MVRVVHRADEALDSSLMAENADERKVQPAARGRGDEAYM